MTARYIGIIAPRSAHRFMIMLRLQSISLRFPISALSHFNRLQTQKTGDEQVCGLTHVAKPLCSFFQAQSYPRASQSFLSPVNLRQACHPQPSVMLRSTHLRSYMLLSHLVLFLSLPCNSHTSGALLVRHEKRSISPEDAAIFEGLEDLRARVDAPPNSYNFLQPHYQPAQELLSPESRGNGNHLLPSTTRSLVDPPVDLLTDGDIELSSSNHPSSSPCHSGTLWHSVLRRLEDDSCSTKKTTPNTAQKIDSEYSKPSASLDASSVNAFHSNEVALMSGSGSTTQVQSTSQSHCSQNQEVGWSQGLFRNLQSSQPVAGRLKRKNSAPLMYGGCFPEGETSVLINRHVPPEDQHDSEPNVKASPQLGRPRKMKAMKQGNDSTYDMAFTKGTTSGKKNDTAKQKASEKDGLSSNKKSQSRKRSKSRGSAYKIHIVNEQDAEFLEGLLHSDPKVRLAVLEKYLQEVWPKAKFTGTESLEGLKESIEKKFQVLDGGPSPFDFSVNEKKGKELGVSTHSSWLKFLAAYRKTYRRGELRWDTHVKHHARNTKMHLLCARAGAQRLNMLGIYTRINGYFLEMKERFYEQARIAGVRRCHLKRRVERYLVPAREGTISMLYQIELLLRLSTTLLPGYDEIHKDYLLKITMDIEQFWKEFKPFEVKPQSQVKEEGLVNKTVFPLTFMDKVHTIFNVYGGDIPYTLEVTRTLFSQWGLTEKSFFFAFLNPNLQSRTSTDLFAFLVDCTIYDLIHMLK